MRDALLGGARRLGALLAVVGGVTLLGSVGLGALAGISLRRSITLGFYLVGCMLLLAGFFVGNRGVLRADSSEKSGFLGLGGRRIRSASGDEQRENTRVSALVISLGIALLILGTLADTENNLA